MGHFFLKNWYFYGSSFKFCGGKSLPKPNLSTSPPVSDYLVAHCFAATLHDHRLPFQSYSSQQSTLALSQSGIILKLNRTQLSAVCCCGQMAGLLILERCCLPLGHPSGASGTCAVVGISPSKRQCGELQASLKAA